MKQSRRNNDLNTLIWRFGCFYMCVPGYCLWTNLVLHFDIKGEISLKQSGKKNNLTTLLWRFFLSLYVCPQVMLLDKSFIALFAFRFSDLIQSGGIIIYPTTLLLRFCCFYMCVPRLCFWMSLILQYLNLDLHFVM